MCLSLIHIEMCIRDRLHLGVLIVRQIWLAFQAQLDKVAQHGCQVPRNVNGRGEVAAVGKIGECGDDADDFRRLFVFRVQMKDFETVVVDQPDILFSSASVKVEPEEIPRAVRDGLIAMRLKTPVSYTHLFQRPISEEDSSDTGLFYVDFTSLLFAFNKSIVS